MGVDLLRDGLLRPSRDNPAESEDSFGGLGQADVSLTPPHPAPPRAEGPCRICGTRAAERLCVRCERPVCPQDHWVMFGLCKECLTAKEMQEAREPRLRPRPDLGIKWIED